MGLILGVGESSLRLLLRGCAHTFGILLRLASNSLGMLLCFIAGPLALGMQRADRRHRLVSGHLGLRPRRVQDFLGLLLGGAHAVGRGAVGLCDALPRTRLCLLPQLRGSALGALHDVRYAR